MLLSQRLRALRKGYTIDQTILIVAIIAILITLVIITVGWQLITRTSGTKLGSQLNQVEDAAGLFFSSQRVWPHQAFTTATPGADQAMGALSGVLPSGLTWAAAINTNELRNYIPGFQVSGTAITGGYGAITLSNHTRSTANTAIGNSQYLVVQVANVPFAEAREADVSIDGNNNQSATLGRLVYSAAASPCIGAPSAAGTAMPTITAPTSGNVNVCYIANLIQ